MIAFRCFIFPGACFALLVGGIGWWIERKLTARFQYRVGPPWYQNFIDVMKLFLKEMIVPRNASRILFILSPLVSFASSLIFTIMVTQSYFFQTSFLGDVIVMFYLLLIPSLFVIFGGFASSNPLALAGATRETKLLLAYEFVFVISLLIVIIKSGGSLMIADFARSQIENGEILRSASGWIGLVLAFFYLQAKLGIVPFDIPEAEQEIMAGPMIEYSGPLLGFYRLSKLFLYFSVPLFIISLFWHGRTHFFIFKYVILILLVSVVKNINPRLRIKDALGFFWFFLFPLGIVGIILALKGF
ncbi:MAG: NADH-quinone oxidoreductase subunit H [Candidatus Omnitrophota bacterium]|nr:MAG: NADH-quinone oxidoreductase subunit H [Candidatus Omnitrophota bacterium]